MMDIQWLIAPFDFFTIPVGDWVETSIKWIVTNYRPVFQSIKWPIDVVMKGMEAGLRGCPPTLFILIVFLATWQVARLRTAIFAALALVGVGFVGAWPEAMTTLAIVLTSVVFCCAVGIPLGIVGAQNAVFRGILRPILDFLQTIPSFVYLVPIVMLFGIGNVSGVIVTIIYALSPVVRLTILGISEVRRDLVEASTAFGASPMQTLVKIQLPLARPAIMAGVNQTIMLSLSMSVIASMISVTGLGQMVLRGIGRLDISVATTGGLGIVLIAMVVDRISQGLGQSGRDRGHKSWYQVGPVGLVINQLSQMRSTPARELKPE